MANGYDNLRFKITRQGRFDIAIVEGNQCGLRGKLGFDYKFIFASDTMDDRQFVIDHHEVETAIAEWAKSGKFKGSCEQVAVAVGNVILSQSRLSFVKGHQYLTVELITQGFASIEVNGTPFMFLNHTPSLEVFDHGKRK